MQINFFPIQFQFDSFQISTENYTSERLTELRNTYNNTHSFFKNGDRIYISNKDGDENLNLGNAANISVYGDSTVTSSLIKHIFFRTFKDRFPNYIPIDFYPFRFFSGQDKDNIIHSALPDNLKNEIVYKKLIEVQLRQINIDNKPQFGFIINIKRNWVFAKSCEILHKEGFNLLGLEVLKMEYLPGMTGVLAPDEEFIGIIREIQEATAKVETNEGVIDFPLSELSIRKTKYNIAAYLSFAISERKSLA